MIRKFLSLAAIGLLLTISCKNTQEPEPEAVSEEVAADLKVIENGLMLPVSIAGRESPRFTIQERMEKYKVPGVSIAVVKDGKLAWARGYGMADTESGEQVGTKTLFQAGSISKPVAAISLLYLMEKQEVDLDMDVNNYLESWQIPENPYTDSSKVTLRRLLNHTAGTTIHGFPGYTQEETMPGTAEVLDGIGNTDPVVVDTIPGSIWRYSGGGYTLAQLVVEDVTALPFDEFIDKNILPKLGMPVSTYDQPLPEPRKAEASAAYNWQGQIIEGKWNNYPEKAAAGLWTTPTDLANFAISIQQILQGDTTGILSRETVEMMLTPGLNDWGLGVALSGDGDSLVFRHGGKNAGFSNLFAATAHQGSAVVVMTNADRGTDLMREIMLAICDYYDFPFASQNEFNHFPMNNNQLTGFTGAFKYVSEDPSEYFVDLIAEGEGLSVVDTNNGETDFLLPVDSLGFLQPETGDYMEYYEEDGQLYFTWNGKYVFVRTSEE